MSDLGSTEMLRSTEMLFQTGREPQYVGPQSVSDSTIGGVAFQTGREPQYVGPYF